MLPIRSLTDALQSFLPRNDESNRTPDRGYSSVGDWWANSYRPVKQEAAPQDDAFRWGVDGWVERHTDELGGLTQSLPFLRGGTQGNGVYLSGGLLRNEWDNGARVNVGALDGRAGEWTSDSGARRWGLDGKVAAADVSTPTGWPVWGELQAFSASASAWGGEDGFSVGAGASLIQGAVGYQSSDPDSQNDRMIRLGGGVGVGAAARGYWSDDDGDGYREYGFGLDVKFLSVDFKTEDPVGDALRFGLIGGPMGMLFANTLMPQDYNLTHEVGAGLETAANEVGEWVATDVKGFFEDAGSTIASGAETAIDEVGGFLQDAGSAIESGAKTVAEKLNPLNWF